MAVVRYHNVLRRPKTQAPTKAEPAPKTGRCAVIVAAYHAQKWIKPCIASIRSQVLPPGWTLDLRIGVDGCPETAETLTRLKQSYYMAEENVGTYVLRNSLIGLRPADCYTIFDADDEMLPTYLATGIMGAGSNGLAGAARRTIHANTPRFASARVTGYFSGVCTISHAAWMQLGGYRADRVASDADLVARARLLNIPIYVHNEPLFYRRTHDDSLTRAKDTGFHSDVRRGIIASHKALRRAGDLVVSPVVTRLVWSGGGQHAEPDLCATLAKSGDVAAVARAPAGDALRHSVYTRIRYDKDDVFTERVKMLGAMTAPAMAAQKGCKPVRWVFICHDRHREAIEKAVRAGGWKGEIAFNERDDSEDIQTTLDSDDWVAPNWLADVQAIYRPGIETQVVYWHPLRYHAAGDRWYRRKRNATWVSMFYSVYRPTPAVHVYVTKHPAMGTIGVPTRPAPTEGLVALVLHGRNMTTKLKGSEVPIPAPKGATISEEARALALDVG